MFSSNSLDSLYATSKAQFYGELQKQLEALLDDYWLTNLANFAALIQEQLRDINWVGFYLSRAETLYLGPFQGKPACLKIPYGKGVCGAAAQSGQTQLVADVDQFPGHIACDSASRSEIVIPLRVNDQVIGVLDVDAPILSRFDSQDASGLEALVSVLVARTAWPAQF